MLVTNPNQLQSACDTLLQHDQCAVDTEFQWTNTYKPVIALIQLAAGDACFIVDPLAVDIAPLKSLFSAPHCVKIFHSCSQDLEVLNHTLNVRVTPIFDTQIAAAFCGYGYQLGYGRLAEMSIGITLDKTAQRSNWLRRPLTNRQLDYATHEVTCLLAIADTLRQSVSTTGKSQWVEEECQQAWTNFDRAMKRRRHVRSIRGYGACRGHELAILAELTSWRDDTACSTNRPPRWIADDSLLINIAKRHPSTKTELATVDGINDQHMPHSAAILDAVTRGLAYSPHELPHISARRPTRDERDKVRKLGDAMADIATNVNIAPELIANRETLLQWVRLLTANRSVPLSGWRREVIGERIVDLWDE